ncbi:oligogalacturonate-specific porin KdgM family protein [Aeromonas hydrophila]|uniref:oligogalacturonate-specific porin KdgM family protein n=1 Tax=Aeromonas hydrophila TaxID=644 RepID=UPI002441C631|nr:oligogalacturonate-specific porin KdgM family protein [Aeromonas hydrophila]
MKCYIKFFPLAIFSLSIHQALANDYKTTVEYRHGYADGSKKNDDRFKIYVDTGKNIGFELDARYGNSNPSQVFDSTYLDGSELCAFYYKALNKNLTGLVGTSFDVSSSGAVHIPFVRLNYRFDNGFRIQGRYKWKFWDYEMTNPQTNVGYRSKIQEFDTWVGYKYNQWDFEYQLDVFKQMADGAMPEFNGKDYDTQHNVKVSYAWDGNWKPFIEVGNIREDRYTSNRQTRYRIGIKYTW